MTNEEKYKTLDERNKAYNDFCKSHECSGGCPLEACGDCHFPWLALEAEEPEPEPCPFCGSAVSYRAKYGVVWYQCDNADCHYMSGEKSSEAAAVAAHNRVARAVRKAK